MSSTYDDAISKCVGAFLKNIKPEIQEVKQAAMLVNRSYNAMSQKDRRRFKRDMQELGSLLASLDYKLRVSARVAGVMYENVGIGIDQLFTQDSDSDSDSDQSSPPGMVKEDFVPYDESVSQLENSAPDPFSESMQKPEKILDPLDPRFQTYGSYQGRLKEFEWFRQLRRGHVATKIKEGEIDASIPDEVNKHVSRTTRRAAKLDDGSGWWKMLYKASKSKGPRK
jgi:hypothetical protein